MSIQDKALGIVFLIHFFCFMNCAPNHGDHLNHHHLPPSHHPSKHRLYCSPFFLKLRDLCFVGRWSLRWRSRRENRCSWWISREVGNLLSNWKVGCTFRFCFTGFILQNCAWEISTEPNVFSVLAWSWLATAAKPCCDQQFWSDSWDERCQSLNKPLQPLSPTCLLTQPSG